MKKTEKIELRVDHAEKERLSAIAERRGHTVSDVVRDALAGELGVARTDYPKWPGRAAIGAIFLSAISLGLVSKVYYAAPSSSLSPLYPTSVNASVSLGDESVSFDITALKPSKRELSVKSKEGETVRLIITSTPDTETSLLTLKSDACIVRGQDCDALELPTVSLSLRRAGHGSVSIFTTHKSESLYLMFSAHTYWPKPIAT